MLVSELKPTEEIFSLLEDVQNVYLVGCNGCAEVCATAGDDVTYRAAETLKGHRKRVTGIANWDLLCNKVFTGTRLVRQIQEVNASNGILVFSCGVGVQVVAAVVDKPVFPATNTCAMGGFSGVWRGAEKCAQCGDCLLGYTGGICPVVACSKGLVNGPCGGTTDDGDCEVEPGRPCAWAQIYRRLKTVGRLDLMRRIVPPRDNSTRVPSLAARRTLHWAVDQGVGEP